MKTYPVSWILFCVIFPYNYNMVIVESTFLLVNTTLSAGYNIKHINCSLKTKKKNHSRWHLSFRAIAQDLKCLMSSTLFN